MQYYVEFHKRMEKYAKGVLQDMETGSNISITEQGKEPLQFIAGLFEAFERSHIYTIDNEVKFLLMMTKPPESSEILKHLPFKQMFLDVSFTKEEIKHYTGVTIEYDNILGMLLEEMPSVFGNIFRVYVCCEEDNEFIPAMNRSVKDIIFNTFNLHIDMGIDQADPDNPKNWNVKQKMGKVHYLGDAIVNRSKVKPDMSRTTEIAEGVSVGAVSDEDIPAYAQIEDFDAAKKTKKFSRMFCLNLLNLIMDPEIILVDRPVDAQRNAARKRRDKIPIPSSTHIRLDGYRRKYVNEMIASGDFSHSYQYWVTGHHRILRHPRYGRNRGKKLWIMPHKRGKGILIQKEYRVER